MSKPDFNICNTVPKAFLHHVTEQKHDIANWSKVKGVWESQTWGEYGANAKKIGQALLTSGMNPGDKVSILSQTRLEWVMCDMAIMCIGCVTAPVYHSNTKEQVLYIAEHSDARLMFIEDQEQLDKILEIWGRLPNVEKAVVFDAYHPKDLPNVTSFADFIETGIDDDSFEQRIESSKPEEVISFIYTSGTTGHPKAGIINSDNVISMIKYLPDMLDIRKEDISLAYLPLAHIAERLLGHFLKLVYGNETAFAESIEDMPDNTRQVGPTILFGTPRVYEKYYARISTGIGDATWVQKKVYNWSVETGRKRSELLSKKESIPITLKFKSAIAKFLIYNKIKDIFGGRIRFMISGAAPISPEIIHYFKWMGITIYEAYGMTETTGVISCNKPGFVKIGSVGQLLPETEVKIADDGEICVRAPQNIKEYYKNEEATNELLKPGSNDSFWLHTGDVGHIDEDGYLFITDRKKDLIITAGGKNVAPQNIENLLKTSPYVSQAMVFGDKKPYLTALITMDEDEIAKFARDHKLLYQDLANLSKKEEVHELYRQEVHLKNEKLASYETIKKFFVLEEDFDQDKDELTPTLKVRRKVVTERYRDILENLYKA
ncbi:MAG: long-chain fatty acid--CoA ligase [Candidatus Marinimicrobia bacterium]|jgi:long-chain acyl-CoA synthetase|nr:long-chain fatty acid--CoA ligase [Candidatus Neomarinimicrobiota bacterium]HJN68361.1 long-chain fatty acid--CoA ligase [Candidatus Neomarinimicrobiota bacterium]